MSGSGRKIWDVGVKLASADLNAYVSEQVIYYYEDAAARTAAIGTPSQGLMSYRADVNIVEGYNGTRWVNMNGKQELNTQAGTAYAITTSDISRLVRFTSGSAVNVTLGTGIASPGERVEILQDGAGTVTLSAGTGVSIFGAGTAGTAYTLGLYEAASIYCVSSNSYRVIGNVRAV
jgi:hypothetical protein